MKIKTINATLNEWVSEDYYDLLDISHEEIITSVVANNLFLIHAVNSDSGDYFIAESKEIFDAEINRLNSDNEGKSQNDCSYIHYSVFYNK